MCLGPYSVVYLLTEVQIPPLAMIDGLLIVSECGRASFYSRLPAGHDKSAGCLAHISCGVAIHYVQNLAFVLITLGKIIVFHIEWYLNAHGNGFMIIQSTLFILLTQFTMEQRDTWVEFPVRSLNFLRVIPADPRGK